MATTTFSVLNKTARKLADIANSASVEGELGDLRRIGLVYVLEFSDSFIKGATTKLKFDDLEKKLSKYSDVLDDFLAGALWTKALPGKRAEPLFSLEFMFSPLLTGRQARLDLARFLVLVIRGISFRDLDDILRPLDRNNYDFGYSIRDALNSEFAATRNRDRVLRVSPDHPFNSFSVSCHPPPEVSFETKYGWEIDEMHLPNAWNMNPVAGSKFGAGILVGHPDTGYSNHQALVSSRTLVLDGYDMSDNDSDARDHLVTTPTNSEPGHGTSTGTLIMSASDLDPTAPVDPNRVIGAATRANIIPIRVCDWTAFVLNSRVAKGLAWSIRQGCHIASLSVGGLFVPGFDRVLNIAYNKNIVVICAAGNCVWWVVAPANYKRALAVGASSRDHTYWNYAPQGSKIAIAAPGDAVRTTVIYFNGATGGPIYNYNGGSGTSFSTGFVAGVCALWMAFFGRQYLIDLQRGLLQDLFTTVAQRTASVPLGWNTARCGAGIINAEAMLQFDLTSLPVIGPRARRRTQSTESTLSNILSTLSESIFRSSDAEEEMVRAAQEWFHVSNEQAALEKIDELGIEMINILIEHGQELVSDVMRSGSALATMFRIFFILKGSLALKTALTQAAP